jgi:DTW domain-containing protein YfiP
LGKLSKEGDASSAEMMTRLLKEMESETVQNALNKEYESFHKRPVIFADERFSIFCF